MKPIRKTYLEVNLNKIESNIKKIVKRFNDYNYFFAVVKADSYGMGDSNTINSIINRWM